MNASNMAYGKERDAVGDERYDAETAYNHLRDDKGDAWTALGNGYYPTGAAELLGISQDQIDAYKNQTQEELAYATWRRKQEYDAAARAEAARQAAARASASSGYRSSGTKKKKSTGGGGKNDEGYDPKNNNQKTEVSADVSDMLQRWYNVNSSERFDQIVAEAIAKGQFTEEEYNAWLDSKGL